MVGLERSIRAELEVRLAWTGAAAAGGGGGASRNPGLKVGVAKAVSTSSQIRSSSDSLGDLASLEMRKLSEKGSSATGVIISATWGRC